MSSLTGPTRKATTLHKWAMFTPAGDEQVQRIVEQAVDIAGTCTDDELWQWCYASLEVLSSEHEFREATDTEVRESVFRCLVAEKMINHETTDYGFYVAWYGPGGSRARFVDYLRDFNER